MKTGSNKINPAAADTVIGLKSWKEYQKIIFRISFIFFTAMCIPLTSDWYAHVIRIDWTNLHCRDLYDIARFSTPSFIKVSGPARYGFTGYLNWLILLSLATAGGFIWTFADSKLKNPAKEYNRLYYWLRVIVRYRAALGIIGFSFEKIFPTQMPYPSLAHLTTNFGDFSGHKIYWLSIGSSPWYQVFGGFVELVPGLLLLFRKTTTLGAALLTGALTTIAIANLGYDGGVHIYASYFTLLGLFLLWRDIPQIWNLLILEKETTPRMDYPAFSKFQSYSSRGVKIAFGIYIAAFSYLQYLNFRFDPYKQVSTKGITELRGNYEVSEFKINNSILPYNPLDSVRWQDVTLESWTSLTFKINKPLKAELSNSGGGQSSSGTGHSSVDLEKNFEGAGVAGGRRIFHYYADTISKTLYLLDKNITAARKKSEGAKDVYPEDWISEEAWKNIGNDELKINKRALSTRRSRDFAKVNKDLIRDKMVLKYETTDGGKTVTFRGSNENKDSIFVVLNRVNRQYALSPPSLISGSYE
jgi:hypothetical protein